MRGARLAKLRARAALKVKIMKNVKNVVAVVFIVLVMAFFFAGSFSFSFFSGGSAVADHSYRVTEYSAEFEYKEGRTFAVTENITAIFRDENKHGIVRDFAMNSGEVYSDITVLSHDCSAETQGNDFIRIFIGDENITVPTDTPITYTITYNFKIPEGGERDMFAINVLGGGWTTNIDSFVCTVTLPSAPEDVRIGGNADYTADGNTYKVTASGIRPFNAITLYALYGAGTLPAFAPEGGEIVALVLGFAVLAAAILLCVLLPKNSPLPVVGFYPPEGIDPLQAGTLIDGKVQPEDLTSIFYYWASKGIINIDMSNADDPVFIMSGTLPADAPLHQKRLFDKVFEGCEKRAVSELPKDFYKAAQEAERLVKQDTPRMNSVWSRAVSLVTAAFAALVYVITLVVRGFGVSDGLFFAMALAGFLPPVAIYLIGNFTAQNRLKYSKKKKTWLFIAQLAVAAAAAVAAYFLVPQTILINYMNILLILASSGTAIAAPYMLRYTKEYAEKLGPLLGFRHFIEIAEKDKLEKMIEGNPSYYYDVLPYAQVLGVSDVWINKFRDINLEPPAWARGYSFDAFDYVVFMSVMNSTSHIMQKSFVPPAGKSGLSGGLSGGGFSGGFGGFSGGGGFGGGGGGSW